jgi:hypothetical protein
VPRKGAGWKYPHITTQAKPHDHTMCPVIGQIATLARSGSEPWGTPHEIGPIPVTQAKITEIRNQLFHHKKCQRILAEHGALSASVTYRDPDGQLVNPGTAPPPRLEGGYVLVIQVWTRERGKANIASRVEAGEPLAFNILRMDA